LIALQLDLIGATNLCYISLLIVKPLARQEESRRSNITQLPAASQDQTDRLKLKIRVKENKWKLASQETKDQEFRVGLSQ